ncbi:MAG: T9SS type A sorting domain-containing protein [Bacteroidota bacterium]
MKTLINRISYPVFFLLTALSLFTAFPSNSYSQGKKIFVGTGSGFIDYPNAQATLNLKDDDTIVINPGKYKLMNFKNITASPGHKIYITNSGQVEFNDPSPSTFSNLTNVEIRGDGTPGVDFGFYLHDLVRGISIDGTLSGVYFSYFKMVNINDYCIYITNPSQVYNGTNASLFYDLKFLHFSVYNIATTFLQLGSFTRIVDDGLSNMTRKLEVAYCTIDYTNEFDVIHMNKVMNANVHHNRLSHLGKNDYRHTGIFYLYGTGDVHHNYISDYWGSGLRAHGFSLDTVGAVNVYDNIMVNSRKYSGVEAQSFVEDVNYSPYTRHVNFKVYNNTFGNLSAYDWNCSMVDTYDAAGGTIEIKNNLGFNIQRDLPYDPAWNFVYQQLNITIPDTASNRYARNYTDLGLQDDISCMLNINSPAIDKGVTIGMVKDDIDGIARPQSAAYDIGAREYLTGIVYPVSNAGTDASTVLPKDSITLNGSASYNPGGGVLTYKWSQVAGPSAAVFASDTAAMPLLKKLVPGTYQVKLTVTNTLGRSNDDIVLIVVSPVPVFPPVAKAGGTTTITLPVNSAGLNGAASSNSGGGALKYAWVKISGPSSFTISGDTTATPLISSLTEGTYQIRLTVTNINGLSASDVATVIVKPAPVPVANAGADVNLVLPANFTTLNGSASATPGGGALKYVWTKVSGPASFTISGDSTVSPLISSLIEGVYQVKLTVTNTAGSTNSDFVNINVSPVPVTVANAGADINLVLPANTATLNGTASYSTGPGILTYEWSLVSGPSSFTIGGASTASPAISDLTEGVYQVKLKVTNIQGSSSEDMVVITVSTMPVYPPVSNAGPDVGITLPANSVTLNGNLSYNPGGGALTYSWSLISGPSSFSITGTTGATPVISNLIEGAYQLKLVVTNAQGASGEDQVTIAVSPAPALPPVANAGADINITLPANSTALDGTKSSNAAGGTLSYAWSLISGPASFAISGPTTATPVISDLTEGSYHLKLIVTNAKGLTAEDVVSVTVSAPPVPVAAAGGSVTLVLPANSVTLDGNSSYQPGGGALNYAWAKISGPAAFAITGNTTATPTISNLSMGIYQVQLTVTNAGGLTASGVVTIAVNLPLLSVPRTGNDTTINFPGGYAILDGSNSYGTGGADIVSYHWQQLSGPTTSLIGNAEISKTNATNLEPGVYTFQLTIIDNYGQKETSAFKVTVVSTTRNNKNVTLYPNPCTDRINVHIVADSSGSSMVRITSLSGVIMIKQSFEKNQLVVDVPVIVSRLSAGMYIVEVIIGKQVQLLDKFIKR